MTGTSSPSASAANGLPTDTASALQQALGTENAAIWVCGLASAFVGSSACKEINAAQTAHAARRDVVQRLLTDAGLTPNPAQPAYVLPQQVTDQASALAAMATAESDGTVAWRAVLERTDDADLRRTGLAALTDCAVRETRFRRLGGISPASIAMPGQPAKS